MDSFITDNDLYPSYDCEFFFIFIFLFLTARPWAERGSYVYLLHFTILLYIHYTVLLYTNTLHIYTLTPEGKINK